MVFGAGGVAGRALALTGAQPCSIVAIASFMISKSSAGLSSLSICQAADRPRRYRRHDGTVFTAMTSLCLLGMPDEASPYATIVQIVAVEDRIPGEAGLAGAKWCWRQALEGSRQVVWDFDVPNGMAWYRHTGTLCSDWRMTSACTRSTMGGAGCIRMILPS